MPPTAPHPAPASRDQGDRPWYERVGGWFEDRANDAADAAEDFGRVGRKAGQDLRQMWSQAQSEGSSSSSTTSNGTGGGPDIGPKPPAQPPTVSDARLGNIVRDLSKGTRNPNRVGDGTTMDAIRNEISTGRASSGKMHLQKGREYVNALRN